MILKPLSPYDTRDDNAAPQVSNRFFAAVGGVHRDRLKALLNDPDAKRIEAQLYALLVSQGTIQEIEKGAKLSVEYKLVDKNSPARNTSGLILAAYKSPLVNSKSQFVLIAQVCQKMTSKTGQTIIEELPDARLYYSVPAAGSRVERDNGGVPKYFDPGADRDLIDRLPPLSVESRPFELRARKV